MNNSNILRKLDLKMFIGAARMVKVMDKLANNPNDKSVARLFGYYIKQTNGVLLPSGRFGTPLALLIEYRNASISDYFKNNFNLSDFDTSSVCSDLGGKNRVSYKKLLAEVKRRPGLNEMEHCVLDSFRLANALNHYSSNPTDKTSKDELDNLLSKRSKYYLPNGFYGNALAMALSINDYVAAEYILDNASRLNIDSASVLFDVNGAPVSAKDVFVASVPTFEFPDENYIGEIQNLFGENPDRANNIINNQLKQNLALQRLRSRLGVNFEDAEFLSRVLAFNN